MMGLTQRQLSVLDYIRDSVASRGYPPTLREIGRALGIRSTNGVSDHLRALERKGYIRRDPITSRGLRVLPREADHVRHVEELSVDGPQEKDVA